MEAFYSVTNSSDLKYLNDLSYGFLKSKSINEVKKILRESLLYFGMDFFLLGVATPYSALKNSVLIVDNYPKEWRDFYDKNQLVKKDPVVGHCLKYHSPILWSQFKKKNYSDSEWKVLIKASEFGVVDGFSIPIHGNGNQFGMLSMASSKKKSDESLYLAISTLQLVIPSIQDAINNLVNPVSNKPIKITPREIECLKWASEGKSSWEMSKIMSCSERTIAFHMSNIGNKLNANNRTQSIAKAILLGYIPPSLEY